MMNYCGFHPIKVVAEKGWWPSSLISFLPARIQRIQAGTESESDINNIYCDMSWDINIDTFLAYHCVYVVLLGKIPKKSKNIDKI